MEYVGVGRRFVAFLVDGILLFIVGYTIAALTGQTTPGGFNLQGLPALLYFIINFGYGIVLEATQGATLGKMLLKLRVVRLNGEPISWSEAVIRNILRIVDAIPYFIPYLTGAILVWTSPKRQRLGDRVANTVVIRQNT